jgi:hypothetical protein
MVQDGNTRNEDLSEMSSHFTRLEKRIPIFQRYVCPLTALALRISREEYGSDHI